MTEQTVGSPAMAEHGEAAADPRRWTALAVVLTAAFMQLIDVSIVNVAIPSIQRDIGASSAQVQLIVAAYSLAYAVLLVTGGRLGDIYGRKRLFLLGMAGFTVASALCGAARSGAMLDATRALQGLVAALMLPQVLAVIAVTFPPRERGTAYGMFGATVGLATITGPLVGGLLIQWDLLGLQWRPIFLVNVPVGVVSLLAAWRYLHESKAPQAIRLDLVGVGLVSGGLFLLVWPLIEGRQAGWPPWAWACLAASAPVLALFVWWEARLTRRPDGSPLVPSTLFHQRAFNAGLVIALATFAALLPFFLFLTLYLQVGLGFSALGAGLTVVPFAIGSGPVAGASGQIARRLGRWTLTLGTAVLSAGVALLWLTIHRAAVPLAHGWELAPALLVGGVGLGLVVAPLVTVILAGIHGRDAGAASGVLTTVNQVGAALGIAVVGVVFFGALGRHAGTASATAVPQLRADQATLGLPAPAADQTVRGFQACFHDRAAAADASVEPASCRAAREQGEAQAQRASGPQAVALAQVGTKVTAASGRALARDFTDVVQLSLACSLAGFVLAMLLSLLLPQARPKTLAPGPPAAG